MTLFIYGPDTFRSTHRLAQLERGFIQKYDREGVNVARLEGEILTLDEFRKHVLSAGLFASKRFIITKHLLTKTKDAELLEGVADYLDRQTMTGDHVVVFWEEELDEKTINKHPSKKKILHHLRRGKTETFPLLTPQELRIFMKKEVEQSGGTIDSQAANLLAAIVRSDLWRMRQEIEKLTNFRANGTIRKEDVELFVSTPEDDNVFHLTDALGEKNLERTLRLLRDQWKQETHPLLLLTKIVWHFRNLLRIREAMEQQPHPSDLPRLLKLHPFVIQKSLPQAGRFDLNNLQRIWRALRHLDLDLKTTKKDPEFLFDLFVLEVCQERDLSSKDS